MPQLKWLPEALQDIVRLHDFVAQHSPAAAQRVVRTIREAADRVEAHPLTGSPMDDERREWFTPFGAGAYVLRYRIDFSGCPVIIRVWHSREAR